MSKTNATHEPSPHGLGHSVGIPSATLLPSLLAKPRQCQCRICERGREFERQIARLSPARKAYFVNLYEYMEQVEFDLDLLNHSMREREAETLCTKAGAA